MALTETQTKVLAALAILQPTQGLTVRQLADRIGFTAPRTRAAMQTLVHRGFAFGDYRSPVRWRVTSTGRSLLSGPPYREFLAHGTPMTTGANR